MDYQEQHNATVKLCDGLAGHVVRGLGIKPCAQDVLVSFNELAEQVFQSTDIHSFTHLPRHGDAEITHAELLAKAGQLRAITGSRSGVTTPPCPSEPEPVSSPLTQFLTTLSAAAIVFLVSAHCALVVYPTVRLVLAK